MLRVGFRRAWVVTNIVLGVVVLGVGASLGGMWESVGVGVGGAVLGGGIFQRFLPYFEFDPGARMISMKAMPGAAPRRYGGVVGSGVLHVSGRRIVCVMADGRTRKVPVVRRWAEPGEWDAVVARLTAT